MGIEDSGSLPWIDSDMAYPWPVDHDSLGTTTSISHHDDASWNTGGGRLPAPPKAPRNGASEDPKLQSSWRPSLLEFGSNVRADMSLSLTAGRRGEMAGAVRLDGPNARPVPPVLARTLKAGVPGSPMPKPTKAKAPRTPKPRKEGGSPRSRGGSTPKSDSISYAAMLLKMPAEPDETNLLSVYLRDELRSLLKRNGISYHKPGRANLMKSKIEMAADLIALLAKGMKSPEQVQREEDEGLGDHPSPRGRKSAAGGSGSPRKKSAPNSSGASFSETGAMKKKKLDLANAAAAAAAAAATADEEDVEEFRKRMKVALT
jgi:hypothetical protein